MRKQGQEVNNWPEVTQLFSVELKQSLGLWQVTALDSEVRLPQSIEANLRVESSALTFSDSYPGQCT